MSQSSIIGTDAFNFFLQFGSVTVELARLLNMRFVPGYRGRNTPINQTLEKVLEYHNRGDLLRRDYQLTNLSLLTRQLQEIEQHDMALLAKFRRDLNKRQSLDQYYGIRQEISTTAKLIRCDIHFKKQESPDFVITTVNDEVFIECTSVHLTKASNKDLTYKIVSAIAKKLQKNYCTPNTALFIDVTNIFFHASRSNNNIDQGDLRRLKRSTISDKELGSVVVFVFMANYDLKRFESNYSRIDGPHIDLPLLSFLDEHYPRGNHYVSSALIPPHG